MDVLIAVIQMTKKKHPQSRADRLALKELYDKPKQDAKVRRKLIASLRDQETEDELKQMAHAEDPHRNTA